MALSPQTYRALMRNNVEYFVESIYENSSLQLVANNFLSTRATSLIFANTLVDFLLARMEVMGQNTELSNLYLRLFKVWRHISAPNPIQRVFIIVFHLLACLWLGVALSK